jgi:MFS family permease
MMTTLSKPEEKEKIAKVIYAHMCLNVTGICAVLQARPNLILSQVKNDPSKMARVLTLYSSLVGALEFFLNPTAGRLSDQYGRKPFLLLSPIINMILKAGVAMNPSLFMIALERIVDGAITTLVACNYFSNIKCLMTTTSNRRVRPHVAPCYLIYTLGRSWVLHMRSLAVQRALAQLGDLS